MFLASIIYKNPLKPGFSIRNILLQFVFLWIVSFQKEAFNGLLKVIDIQNIFHTRKL
jgi:hypothetical protein